ncbi:MAG: hypothetical protein M3340_00535 [Actinomycetota bacterium]|nr:hypothetical protein [Actinomycetota bacterium]
MTLVPRTIPFAILAALAALALMAAPAHAGTSADWRELAAEMAAPWPDLQKGEGELIDYMDEYTNPGGKPGGTRYGDALMGYALIQTGLRAGKRAWIDTGIRSISWATDPNRYFPPDARSDDSVFEQWGVAAAYNLARTNLKGDGGWEKHRERWEEWLRRQKTVRFGTGRRFSNHDLVEAVMVLELLDTGLTSSDPGAVVGGGREQAMAQVLRLVNTVAPLVVGDRNPAFISDPPDMPAAYHALSFGLYSHLVSRLGDRATEKARIVVRRSADGSWRMAAPDADQAIWGRSQELVWAYPAAAYGASIAAGLPDTSAADAARYRALVDRSLERLRRDYPVSNAGQLVSPGLATDRISVANLLEGYVGAPSMGGLALVFLNQALDEPRASIDGPRSRLASDVDTEAVIADNEASFGVARRGSLWYAVRASRIREGRLSSDVRYDLGLVALKRFEDGVWRDIVTHRPNTMGQDRRDSIGPVRISGQRLYPAAPSTVEPAGDGGFLLRGGFWLDNRNKGMRRAATFRFMPTACGVAQTFPGKRGEVYEMSFFFRERPVKSGRVLSDSGTRVTVSVPFGLQIHANNHRSRPYASAMHGPLFRARVRARMPKSGKVTFETC